jgi:hypothetical protein
VNDARATCLASRGGGSSAAAAAALAGAGTDLALPGPPRRPIRSAAADARTHRPGLRPSPPGRTGGRRPPRARALHRRFRLRRPSAMVSQRRRQPARPGLVWQPPPAARQRPPAHWAAGIGRAGRLRHRPPTHMAHAATRLRNHPADPHRRRTPEPAPRPPRPRPRPTTRLRPSAPPDVATTAGPGAAVCRAGRRRRRSRGRRRAGYVQWPVGHRQPQAPGRSTGGRGPARRRPQPDVGHLHRPPAEPGPADRQSRRDLGPDDPLPGILFAGHGQPDRRSPGRTTGRPRQQDPLPQPEHRPHARHASPGSRLAGHHRRPVSAADPANLHPEPTPHW